MQNLSCYRGQIGQVLVACNILTFFFFPYKTTVLQHPPAKYYFLGSLDLFELQSQITVPVFHPVLQM